MEYLVATCQILELESMRDCISIGSVLKSKNVNYWKEDFYVLLIIAWEQI